LYREPSGKECAFDSILADGFFVRIRIPGALPRAGLSGPFRAGFTGGNFVLIATKTERHEMRRGVYIWKYALVLKPDIIIRRH